MLLRGGTLLGSLFVGAVSALLLGWGLQALAPPALSAKDRPPSLRVAPCRVPPLVEPEGSVLEGAPSRFDTSGGPSA